MLVWKRILSVLLLAAAVTWSCHAVNINDAEVIWYEGMPMELAIERLNQRVGDALRRDARE